MKFPQIPARRRFLASGAGLLAVGALPARARASVAERRELEFFHTHTRERLGLVYAVGDQYLDSSLRQLNRFLRDHYSGEVGHMDPLLFDQLHRVRALLGADMPYEVISGYRCPETNSRLRQTGGGGVARKSLHMEGRAIDVRLPGVPLAELRDAALSLQAGGVGYYPDLQFVHVDTGRVRRWG
ncbi:MAG: hypothetical protein RJA36_3281 [Pseudomonadota bacterium]|jgi:uncharacterized protein YcbK (DUF882 family)